MHPEGRVFFTSPTASRYEYIIRDHLGNARMMYTDLNNDGIIATPTKIFWEGQYYPFGLAHKGAWMDTPDKEVNYKYNGIELASDLGLNVNLATFRTLDPAIGRWWQVDPKGEYLHGYSPYSAMNNNPITYYDPDGDIAPLVWAAIAIAGGGLNVWRNWDHIQNGGGWGAGFKAFGVGATAAVVGTIAAPVAATGATLGATVGSFAAAGAVGGSVGGAIEGFGNSLFFSDGDIFDHLGNGITHGVIGGVAGAALGATTGGIAFWLRPPGVQGSVPLGQGSGSLLDAQNVTGTPTRLSSVADDGFSVTREITVSAPRSGTFSVSDWTGYPSGISRPSGPFRLLQGQEYKTARALADKTNVQLRRQWGLTGKPYDIHEIHPVKFGGSPTDLANKMILPRGFHRRALSPWWLRFQRGL